MRLESAGARVYRIGDVASYSRNYVLDVYAAVLIVMHNILNHLLAHELRLASPYGRNQGQIDALDNTTYFKGEKDSQLCPISRFGGEGMLIDNTFPSMIVHLLKSRDYLVCKAGLAVNDGGNRYVPAFTTAGDNKHECGLIGSVTRLFSCSFSL